MLNPRYIAGCTVALVASYFAYRQVGGSGPTISTPSAPPSTIDFSASVSSVYQQVTRFSSVYNAVSSVQVGNGLEIKISSFTSAQSKLKAAQHQDLDIQPTVDQLAVVRAKINTLADEANGAGAELFQKFANAEKALTRMHEEPGSQNEKDLGDLVLGVIGPVLEKSLLLVASVRSTLQDTDSASEMVERLLLDVERWRGQDASTESGGIGGWFKQKVLGKPSKDNLATEVSDIAKPTIERLRSLHQDLSSLAGLIQQTETDEVKGQSSIAESGDPIAPLRQAIKEFEAVLGHKEVVLEDCSTGCGEEEPLMEEMSE